MLRAAHVLHGGPVGPEDLAPAQDANLVTVREDRLEFGHPLIRSGVIQAAGAARVHAAHTALAGVLPDQPYRRIRHLAQAVVGPDDDIADALEEIAAVAAGRALLSAIADLERGAQLTSSSRTRGRRLLDAAEHAFALGRADLVDELVTEAFHTDLGELDRARGEWLREIFDDGVAGDAPRVFELCAIAERSAAAGEPGIALNLLLGAALRCWWADTGPQARNGSWPRSNGWRPGPRAIRDTSPPWPSPNRWTSAAPSGSAWTNCAATEPATPTHCGCSAWPPTPSATRSKRCNSWKPRRNCCAPTAGSRWCRRC
ncbi:hypothetical protein ACFQ9X_10065 [Catenulispora yoronensis]